MPFFLSFSSWDQTWKLRGQQRNLEALRPKFLLRCCVHACSVDLKQKQKLPFAENRSVYILYPATRFEEGTRPGNFPVVERPSIRVLVVTLMPVVTLVPMVTLVPVVTVVRVVTMVPVVILVHVVTLILKILAAAAAAVGARGDCPRAAGPLQRWHRLQKLLNKC